MKLTKKQLKQDLYNAYNNAKKHKNSRSYVIYFNKNLEENINELCETLYSRTYKQKPLTCFIIDCPKKREIFAADFRDRIVQHLLYNYIYDIFDRTFIEDSYSCRIGKGTHYGINRLKHHILSCSENYSKECYCLKMDIKGYFIHINKQILLNEVLTTLSKYRYKFDKQRNNIWNNILDFEFIKYLCTEIILSDITQNCIKRFTKEEFNLLSKHKSMFFTEFNCGLPIGNLTSQLFSNVYMNKFDQYVKRVLKCKYYGRYVDDFYIISNNKQFLHTIIKQSQQYLKDNLHLDVQQGKTQIKNVKYGIEFLGAYIKPYRIYVSNSTLIRMKNKINIDNKRGIDKLNSINTRLGILSHYKTYKISHDLILNYITKDCT